MNDSWNDTGASRRKVANAPSRMSSSRPQKSHELRSMSDSGTSAGAAPFTLVAIPTPGSLRPALMTGPTLGPSLLLHLCLEHMPHALLKFLTDPALVVAED